MLNLLHPSGELAQDAYTKLLAAVFGTLTETMNPQSLKDKIAPWVKDFIKGWVSKFDKGEPPTVDKKQHEAWEIAEAFKETAHLVGDLTEFASEITNLIVTERVSNISERPFGVSPGQNKKKQGERCQKENPREEEKKLCQVGVFRIFLFSV